MRKSIVVVLGVALLTLAWGCVQVDTPDRISVGGGQRPHDIDATRIPQTENHADARAELRKAYEQIRYLENRNGRLREELAETEADLDECERKLDRWEDRFDD